MNKQKGAGLIETMVALFVLAVGLLGYSSTIITSVNLGQRSYIVSQAVYLSGSLLDRIRSNREAVNEYALRVSDEPAPSIDCTINICDESEVAAWDLSEWIKDLEGGLPEGDAEIEVETSAGVSKVSITLFYRLKAGEAAAGNKDLLGKLESYTVSTEI